MRLTPAHPPAPAPLQQVKDLLLEFYKVTKGRKPERESWGCWSTAEASQSANCTGVCTTIIPT